MAHTKVTVAGNGNVSGDANTYSYSGSFDVFKATEVVAVLDNVALTYTTSTINDSAIPREYSVNVTAKTIHVGGGDLVSGNELVIKPITDMGAPTPRATYTPGASINAADLNNNQTQLMRKALEYDDQKLSSSGGTMTGNLHFSKDIDISFEGATENAYETTLTLVDPTADRTITLPNVSGTVVTTGDTATITATMMADNSVDTSEIAAEAVTTDEIENTAVTTAKIATGAVTTAKIAPDNITSALIADDQIDSEHYVDGSIDLAHMSDNSVDSDQYVNGSIDLVHMSANSVDSDQYVNGSIDNVHIADATINANDKLVDGTVSLAKMQSNSVNSGKIVDNSVTTAKIDNDAVTGDQLADNAINSEHYTDGSIDLVHMSPNSVDSDQYVDGSIDLAHMSANSVDSDQYVDGSIDTAHIGDDQIDSQHYAAGSIDNEHLADDAVGADELAANAVVNASVASGAAIAHSKLAALSDTQILVGNGSNVPTGVAVSGDVTIANTGAVTIAANAVEIGMIGCEQTTISDSDSHVPTSGAVVDYVAAQLAPIGGLEVIADEDNFPSQPASGVVISISDAGGIVVNGSGTSTTARTAGNGSDNVTINNFPSDLHSTTLAAGVGLMITSTGSSNTYNYHKALLKEADLKNLSSDIDDFGNRYRVHAGEPSSNNDDGDMVWDTNANKMKVYDSTASAWKEVTSTGDFKFLVAVDAGTTTAASWDGSDTSFDLKETTNSGSAASISNINQLIVSLNGVIQKPNTGTYSASEEGFYLTDSDTIRFCTAPPTGSTSFILQCGSAVSIPTPGDNTVTAAKIVGGAVVTAGIGTDAVTAAKIADLDADVKFVDSAKIVLGTGNDCKIHFNGTNTVVDQFAGNFEIAVSNASEYAAKFIPDGAVELYYNGIKKIETFADGTKQYGHSHYFIADEGDSAQLILQADDGDDNADTWKIIGASDGNFYLQNYTSGGWETNISATGNSDVKLYFDNAEKFKTYAGGCVVTGQLTADAVSLGDGEKILLGTGDDVEIYHDSADTHLVNKTGILYIKNNSKFSLGCWQDGKTALYYNDSKKFETISSGVKVTGYERITEGTIYLEKSSVHHHRIIINDQGNDFAIQQSSDSGANTNFTSYLRIKDGGNVWLPVDEKSLVIGANEAFKIYGNGNNVFIDQSVGNLRVSEGGTERIELQSDGDLFFKTGLKPWDNDTYDVGSSSNRWDDVYATNGTINTSDRNEKNTIVTSDLGLPFVNKLKPVSYKFNGKTRTHYGLIAQDVETTLSDISKSPTDFAGFIKTTVTKDGYSKETLDTPKVVYGLRYNEFISPLIKAVQELSAEVETLKTKVAALEAG